MIDQEQKEHIRNVCLDTINLLNQCHANTTSDLVKNKIDKGLKGLEGVLLGLENPDLTDEEFARMGDKLTEMGEDLIAYGHLIMPPSKSN